MKVAALGVGFFILSISSVFAQNTATGTGVGVARSRSNSQANAISGQGVGSVNTTANLAVISNSTIPSDTTVRTAPQVVAPGLSAAGLETCLGSVSGAASVIGVGASFGTSIPDSGCAARLDARTLWSFKLYKAAIARLCQQTEIYNSMPEVCVQYMPQYASANAESVSYEQPAYAGGPVEVVVRSTGEHRICDDYNVAKQRCRTRLHN